MTSGGGLKWQRIAAGIRAEAGDRNQTSSDHREGFDGDQSHG
jgi:hypothetical protein